MIQSTESRLLPAELLSANTNCLTSGLQRDYNYSSPPQNKKNGFHSCFFSRILPVTRKCDVSVMVRHQTKSDVVKSIAKCAHTHVAYLYFASGEALTLFQQSSPVWVRTHKRLIIYQSSLHSNCYVRSMRYLQQTCASICIRHAQMKTNDQNV